MRIGVSLRVNQVIVVHLEAVARRCSVKKVFLEILQNTFFTEHLRATASEYLTA